MRKKELAAALCARLREVYPAAECALRYDGEPWKLMVMGRLSAQCTDARVNIVCGELFSRWRTPAELAAADIADIEQTIRSCGLYRTKAADIRGECDMLCREYAGVLPRSMEELLRFPGVGRKIANLLLGDIYALPAIVADTHCIRLAARMGLTKNGERDPRVTEDTLKTLIDPPEQNDFCHRLVMLGREYCTARSPRCADCPLNDLCKKQITANGAANK